MMPALSLLRAALIAGPIAALIAACSAGEPCHDSVECSCWGVCLCLDSADGGTTCQSLDQPESLVVDAGIEDGPR